MNRVLLIAVAALTYTSAVADEPTQDGEMLFARRVGPLLHQKCLACHGNDAAKIQGGLDLRSRTGLIKGGDSGQPAVTPGKPGSSPLLLAVTRSSDDWAAMPPKDAEKLTVEQIGWIKEWIAAGAPWPKAGRSVSADAAGGVVVETSGGLTPEWTNRRYQPDVLWAYQPVRTGREPGPPDAPEPIDFLIDDRMPDGLRPAPRADRAALVRRATFDLTGLPPSPAEVATFVDDPLPDDEAFAKLVDRLLASPHYGERMAQHWLDVVRYADSAGFSNDFERGNAWRYRDYVVRSFNSDKPYDEFVREQLAGDEIDPRNAELLVATGLLRMGPWELTGMEVPKVARQRFLDDVTNIVGETFLAHSLQCARCHDHKFDPVPTRDYYSIQAVFASTQLAERSAPFLPVENVAGFEERQFLELRRDEYLATLRRLDDVLLGNAERWFAEQGRDSEPWRAAVAEARSREPQKGRRESEGVFNRARGIVARKGVVEADYPPKLYGFTPEQYGIERVARKGLERLRWELERYEPFALAVYSGRTPDVKSVNAPVRIPPNHETAGELEQTAILTGGNPFSPSEPVGPGVLSVLASVEHPAIPDAVAGRRRAFAEWVASPDNPLTTRAIVNRIWLWHFNQPLAGNPNNFGATGKRPTHPDLLDWLAATFVADGWSIKAMHRRIMNSEAYCRSAEHPDRAALASRDPLGTSYAVFKPRRLSAEELRDAMLGASGELNPMLGGIPNRPEINLEAALQPRQVMGTFAAAWTPNPLPHQRHRRSLYALKLRGLADPFLEVFNAPAPDFSCERREISTVAPQVFSLFNGQVTHGRALALAHRVMKETEAKRDVRRDTRAAGPHAATRETTRDELAVTRCFELALSRRPTADELRICIAHWRATETSLGEAPPPATPPREVRRDAVEENTGERFSFAEKLYAYDQFVPDLQPADVPKQTRALADVCLALFNSNEFVYVY
jgi:mono/diheme cytochrome c family protein